jgi:hypothetical protein
LPNGGLISNDLDIMEVTSLNPAGYYSKPIRISSGLDLMSHFGEYLPLENYFRVGSPSNLFIFLYLSVSSEISLFIEE